MFSKVFKFFVLLALGTLLASCPALGIKVAFDTAGPNLLSDQDEMILGDTQYGIRFDEPIKLSNPQNASITMTVNPENGLEELGPFDLKEAAVEVDKADSARLIITIPYDYEQKQAGDTITFAIPKNYLTDEADNPNAAQIEHKVKSVMPPGTIKLGEMLVTGKVIPNAADIADMSDPFIQSVIFGYAGYTVKEVVYVTVDGAGSGTSWDDAAGKNDLKTRLDSLTDPGEAHVSFLLVGDGTYLANELMMKNRVAIIGGWMANGDWRHEFENDPLTIFSGDEENRVFVNTYSFDDPLTETALLHSVKVQGGGPSDVNGGGMYNSYSSPRLIGVTFSGNDAGSGGGMYNNYSSPTLMGVTFSGNNAAGSGGGMYNNYSGPTLVDVTFSTNQATDGGGMYNDNSLPTLKKVTFSANQATNGGGGGMYNYAASAPTLSNVTFSANQATNGGGMYNHSDSAPTLINVTFWGNTAGVAGGGMFNANNGGTGPALIINSLFWKNMGGINSVTQDQQIHMGGDGSMTIYNSIVQHGIINTSSGNGSGIVSDGVGWATNASGRIQSHSITDTDPLLEQGLDHNDGFIQTHALKTNSPAIDAGLYVWSAFDTASNTMTWYYSNDESTWFTDPADQTNTANPPGEAMDMTATDARDFSRDRPDIGAYEYSATRYSSP